MKFKKHHLKKYKIILLFILITIVLFYIFSIIQKINLINKYKNVTPSEILISDQELTTKLYFNNILGQDTALDPIIELINQAEHSIELVIFSFDSHKMRKAIYDAANRGIKVTLILDNSRKQKHDNLFSALPNNINRIDVGNFDEKKSENTFFMHHKIVLIDRDQKTEKLSTGSLNFTSKAEKYEQSFLLITQDAQLIKSYKKEIDFLKNSISNKEKIKEKNYNPWISHIKYPDNSYIDVWVSPGFYKNSIKYKIIDEIKKAKEDIKIIMWSFTDKNIAEALLNKAINGIPVKIITEDLFAYDNSSVIPYLENKIQEKSLNNFEIILDTKSNDQIDLSKFYKDFTPFIHQHFMITDNKTLVFGANNWSYWGFYKNDESTIITNNNYLVSEFEKNFNYFYQILK